MSWDYRISRQAAKSVKRFPGLDQKHIFGVLEEMRQDPFGGDVKPMQGEYNLWRRRIGAYRIYFRPLYEQQIFEVPKIERKQSH